VKSGVSPPISPFWPVNDYQKISRLKIVRPQHLTLPLLNLIFITQYAHHPSAGTASRMSGDSYTVATNKNIQPQFRRRRGFCHQ
jgi:hypothetical protein